jgi:hypothetical protein
VPRRAEGVTERSGMWGRDVGRFLAALGPAFYADDAAIRDAIRRHASVNIIHPRSETAVRFDVSTLLLCRETSRDRGPIQNDS